MKQIREENNNNGKKADKMHVKEWLHQHAKRPVKVKFGPDESFYLLNRKGDKLRTIPVKIIESMVVEVTQDTNKRPMVLIRVLKDHDLVLEFSYVAERKKFLAKLENFLTGQ
jgi:dual oxidase